MLCVCSWSSVASLCPTQCSCTLAVTLCFDPVRCFCCYHMLHATKRVMAILGFTHMAALRASGGETCRDALCVPCCCSAAAAESASKPGHAGARGNRHELVTSGYGFCSYATFATDNSWCTHVAHWQLASKPPQCTREVMTDWLVCQDAGPSC
jgi:hypothetical protein